MPKMQTLPTGLALVARLITLVSITYAPPRANVPTNPAFTPVETLSFHNDGIGRIRTMISVATLKHLENISKPPTLKGCERYIKLTKIL
jgi:hypothetical protein